MTSTGRRRRWTRASPRGGRVARARWALACGCGFIRLARFLFALVGMARQHMGAEQLDAESLMLARQVLLQADDVNRAEAEMDARLAARGAGGYGFTGPTAGLFMAMQGAPGVSMMSIGRDPDGMLRATLAAAKSEEINKIGRAHV